MTTASTPASTPTPKPPPEKLRAWWAHRQGLLPPTPTPSPSPPANTLAATGWARSVGGANPYVTLFARSRTSRAAADDAAAALDIHELPSARGCTYVLPAADYALGLTLARPGAQAAVKVLTRLGVPDGEVDRLAAQVRTVLDEASTPLLPAELRERLGDAVRNLGDEGRKKGASTTLPATLGVLQAAGEIRRVPAGGRLDQQRFAYTRWDATGTVADAGPELARRYFAWTGGASLAQFRWFSGFGARDAKAAVADLELVEVAGTDLLMRREDATAFADFEPPAEPSYALVCWIDGLILLRRDLASMLDAADARRSVVGHTLGGLSDLATQAIVDRGRLVGLWEYDPGAGEIVWASFVRPDDALRAAVAETQDYVRDQLGDLRGSSMDTAKVRKPRIEAIKALKL
ncbi:crosslink repair DNA glycosylase YcaQ family protein [Phytomonospora sp. NPDC050363]|uniref:DNA glycosylase AlkZ-like family protein n=1 Tax=Phytomonospora sp. NPDC050363 TaxID=3155642 RepID=UPI0033FA31A7